MKTEYEMSDADLSELLEACKPVPCMLIGGFMPSSPQENANRAWASLGRKMEFNHMTVEPISGKPMKFFRAESTAKPPREVDDSEIIQTMKANGGGFAKALANAACHADVMNLATIKTAFPTLWTAYANMARQINPDPATK